MSMLEKGNPEMPLKTQAELLGISYSSLFHEPVPATPGLCAAEVIATSQVTVT